MQAGLPALGFLSCHLAALFGAPSAGFSAFTAVLHLIMFGTFVTTGLADIGADCAQLFGRLTIHTHYLCRCITDCGTFHIQLDAAGHHFYISFLQAGRCAVVANGCAAQAGIDTALIHLVVRHNLKFYRLKGMHQTANHESCFKLSNQILMWGAGAAVLILQFLCVTVQWNN
jgi:hypothetical protein